jgi:multidrug efflux pump subunit AcrA (membrane-fusion protein)
MDYKEIHKGSEAYNNIYRIETRSKVKYWFWGILGLMLLLMFLPWTQNISSRGITTTLSPENRPQDINSPIPGRIVRWYVREGNQVQKGDTLLQISEIKEDYLDPNLVGQTQKQATAKQAMVSFYNNKAIAYQKQIDALQKAQDLKTKQLENKQKQLKNKLAAETAELAAAQTESRLAQDQLERLRKLFADGLASQTQVQQRELATQNAQAKVTIVDNKRAQTIQDQNIVALDLLTVPQDYAEKINKAEGERLSALSQAAGGEADFAKLENQVANYTIRNGMYYILAPQSGQVVQTKNSGIGEVLKETDTIMRIVPSNQDLAVEIYVRPMDQPLVAIGQKVRFMFDGFPAIIFSGWPEGSYGTFGGKIMAFETTTNKDGYYRVLVAPDFSQGKWPKTLPMGTGAQAIMLLNDVPIWYELWRNINGFPPNYYKNDVEQTNKK